MGRDLDPELDALIQASVASADDPATLRQVFTLDVQLNDGTELHLSTQPVEMNGNLYSPILKEPGVLRLTLFADDDTQDVKVSNVEPQFGQTLTGAQNVLDGARATSGVLFIDVATADQWFDERLPGELIAGEVDEEKVDFGLVDELYAIIVAGERVIDVHPFRQPPAPEVRPDPVDNAPTSLPNPDPTRGWIPPGGRGDDFGERPGRYQMPLDFGVF